MHTGEMVLLLVPHSRKAREGFIADGLQTYKLQFRQMACKQLAPCIGACRQRRRRRRRHVATTS